MIAHVARPLRLLPLALALAAALASPAVAERVEDPTTCGLFPRGDVYPPYLADPGRAGLSLVGARFVDSEIPDAGDDRIVVRLGGKFGLYARCGDNTLRDWQIDILGGFLGHFDVDSSLDSIGWDGYYGALLTWGDRDALSYKVGILHDSAHVGDEYAEETGRLRIGYTREEVVGGVSYRRGLRWRVYAEAGYQVNRPGNSVQDDWRAQVGIEWLGEPHRSILRQPARWFVALDVESLEERDWQPRLTLQSGLYLWLEEGARRYRLGIEVFDGPSALGEFVLRDETYIGAGLWFDI